jgi:two-component system OmpR family sensor kinase
MIAIPRQQRRLARRFDLAFEGARAGAFLPTVRLPMPATPPDPDRSGIAVMDLISHELLSPLTAIKGYTETLLRQAGRLAPADQQEFHRAVLSATRRLEYRITQMLELAQLRAGTVSLSLETVDLVPLTRAVLARAADSLGVANLSTSSVPTLALDVAIEDAEPRAEDVTDADAVPVLVAGDLQHLHHVLAHVVGNAVQYSPAGGPIAVQVRSATRDRVLEEAAARGFLDLQTSITLGAHGDQAATLSAPRLVEIAVTDAGVGIAPEHLQRIFDPFYQVDRLLTREAEGLGLGLPICKALIELHGGVMWAERPPEGGSSFRLLLPELTAPIAAAASAAQPTLAVPPGRRTRARPRARFGAQQREDSSTAVPPDRQVEV